MLEYSLNKLYSDIFCFSTTRHGGLSSGNYASFNCNWYCGDQQERVEKNQELLRRMIPVEQVELLIPRQVHSSSVLTIDEDFLSADEAARAEQMDGVDALITDRRGECLCISTADCIPVLCYDPVNHAVAAIHAGWRGTVSRIVSKTIKAMQQAYATAPSDVWAIIGPGISLQAFEVGNEVYDRFSEAGFDMDRIARRYQKWHIDLWEANRIDLLDAGVTDVHIELSGVCTFNECDDFFSARRLGIKSGRILSGIVMKR